MAVGVCVQLDAPRRGHERARVKPGYSANVTGLLRRATVPLDDDVEGSLFAGPDRVLALGTCGCQPRHGGKQKQQCRHPPRQPCGKTSRLGEEGKKRNKQTKKKRQGSISEVPQRLLRYQSSKRRRREEGVGRGRQGGGHLRAFCTRAGAHALQGVGKENFGQPRTLTAT
jgi:hypothetical protein